MVSKILLNRLTVPQTKHIFFELMVCVSPVLMDLGGEGQEGAIILKLDFEM